MTAALEFREITPSPAALVIEPQGVARLAQTGPAGRWDEAVCEAIDEARRMLAPRARLARLTDAELAQLVENGTPVGELLSAGERWAFVATIGSALEQRVGALFESGDFLPAVLLDAAGSVAVEALVDLVEEQSAAGQPSSRFSPGYCGWPLTGQQDLLELLAPTDLGVSLAPSMLMTPLKSVSGMVVRAQPEQLRLPPAVCARCDQSGCARRSDSSAQPTSAPGSV